MNTTEGIFRKISHPDIRVLLAFFVSLPFFSCSQDVNREIKEVDRRLKDKTSTVSEILSNEQYRQLHRAAEFRKLIREHAPAGSITIVSKKEPGMRIKVKGIVLDRNNQPSKNMLMYFYHTMHNGLYADSNNEQGNQNNTSQLFGYVRTDSQGKFEINTIKPAGYPGERFPSHIHVEIYDSAGATSLGTEFQFADDPRLDKNARENSERFGNIVSDNVGSKSEPVYHYKIQLR